jgi:hypothetical protein
MAAKPGIPPAIPTDWPTIPLSPTDRQFMQLDWGDTPEDPDAELAVAAMPELTVGWSYRVAAVPITLAEPSWWGALRARLVLWWARLVQALGRGPGASPRGQRA